MLSLRNTEKAPKEKSRHHCKQDRTHSLNWIGLLTNIQELQRLSLQVSAIK